MRRINIILSWLFLVMFLIVCVGIIIKGGEVPLHWNIKGKIDSIGSCWNVVVLAIIEIVVFVGLIFLQKNPQYCNIPYELQNREKADSIIKEIIGWLNTCMALTMLIIAISIYLGKISFVSLLIVWSVFTWIFICKIKEVKRK